MGCAETDLGSIKKAPRQHTGPIRGGVIILAPVAGATAVCGPMQKQ